MDGKDIDFDFKLRAANYHLLRLYSIFQEHKKIFYDTVSDASKSTPEEIMIFFYHCDAFLYEMSSCFDMILQYVFEKCSLDIQINQIKWAKQYKKALEKKSPKIYKILEDVSKEWWFNDLKVNRDYIAHHGRPNIGFEVDDKEVRFPFFGNPGLPKRPIHERRIMFEQGDLWGDKMSKLFMAVKAEFS